MKPWMAGTLVAIASIVIFPTLISTMSEEAKWDPKLIADDQSIMIEKQVIPMSISKDNQLPWAYVEGQVTNGVEGYPVIIQIYKDGKPVHFAQTDVKSDGSYEYMFRVRNVDHGKVIQVFEGDYTVKIFKTAYVNPQASIV